MKPTSPFTSLRAANIVRDAEWNPDGPPMSAEYRALELGGEVGELLNNVKKLVRERMGLVGSRTTMQEVEDEIADVVISTDLLAMALGINLKRAVARKFNHTSRKYGLSTRMQESQ